eukprot:gene15371-biopygen12655
MSPRVSNQKTGLRRVSAGSLRGLRGLSAGLHGSLRISAGLRGLRRSPRLSAGSPRGLRGAPRGSAGVRVTPPGSTWLRVAPRGSTRLHAAPRGSAWLRVAPRASAWLCVAPRHSGRIQWGSTGLLGAPPHSCRFRGSPGISDGHHSLCGISQGLRRTPVFSAGFCDISTGLQEFLESPQASTGFLESLRVSAGSPGISNTLQKSPRDSHRIH